MCVESSFNFIVFDLPLLLLRCLLQYKCATQRMFNSCSGAGRKNNTYLVGSCSTSTNSALAASILLIVLQFVYLEKL